MLEELRGLGVFLEAEGDLLHVDAPVGVVTEELRATLAEHKPKLLKLLEWERRKLEEADRRGLVIKWAKEPGWISYTTPRPASGTTCAPRSVRPGSWRMRKPPQCGAGAKG